MTVLSVEITLEAGDWPSNLEPLAERALVAALEGGGYVVEGPCEVSVLLTDDAAQKELNRRWRDTDSTTNVLSFPSLGPEDAIEGMLGDISLAFETLMREAAELEKPFEAHFTHLLVHAMLHLLGYDHLTDEEALAMEARETDIMAVLGFADPYEGQELIDSI